MSNAKRPTTARRVTRTSETKRKSEMDLGLSITVDGETYTVRQGDLTSMDTMALRRETGLSFVSLLQAFQSSPDIDLIAALVWLARRIDGEKLLSFADVAEQIGYDVDVDVVEAEPESDPEA